MFTDAMKAAEYAVAGNATITLSSKKTGNRYTYKVRQAEDNKHLMFVGLLSGPDNESDFTYLGILKNDEFKLTAKSKMKEDSTPVKAFKYFVKKCFHQHVIPDDLEVRHEGNCGRCGRTLTVPESIDSGFGPECIKKVTTREKEIF